MQIFDKFKSQIRPKVIAVDDHASNLVALSAILGDLACELVSFSSGFEVLDYLQANTSDVALILLDAQMPTLDGFQTAKEIQKNQEASKIPLIFLTALDSSNSVVEKAYASGAVDFIFKPFNTEILLKKVSVFLELYSSRLQVAQKEKANFQARLKMVTDSVPALIAYLDQDLRYQFINAEFEKWFRKGSREILGHHIRDVIGEKAFAERKIYLERALSGETVSFESALPQKEQPPRETHVSIRPDTNERGQVIGLVIHASDISQAKKLEREMSDLIARFQSLFESIPQLVFIAGPNGQVSQYNSKWFEYTGQNALDPVRGTWAGLIHPEDAEQVRQKWEEVRDQARPWVAEFRLRRFDGIYRWQLGRSVPILDDDANIVRWIGTITDIEDQKKAYENQRQAQERIAEGERLLEKVFNESPVSKAVVIGENFIYNRANGKYLELLDQTDIIGQSAFQIQPHLEDQNFIQNLKKVLNTKNTLYTSEVLVRNKLESGEYQDTFMDLFYQPLLDNEGQIFGILIQGTDVTEKVQAQAKLKRNTQRADFLARVSSVLNSSLDVDNILRQLADISVPEIADWCSIQIRQANGELKQVAVSHKDPEKVKWAWELHKRYPTDLSTPQGVGQVVRTGQPELMNFIPEEMLRKAAQDKTHEKIILDLGLQSYMCVPIRTRENIIGALSLISTKESNRTYSEEDLHLAQEIGIRSGVAVDNARLYFESQKINRIKDEFLATLSHELRTPLNVIQGYAEILKADFEELSTEELQRSIDAIYRNAHTQTALVGDLLDVSSIITGKISYHPKAVSPLETFHAIYSSLKPTAEAKGVKLICDVQHAPKMVNADPTRLHQILWNLASNAMKFTDAGGEVRLSLLSDDHSWTIQVADTGLGIDPEFLPFIFDRFTQEDSSRTRRFGGLGLGLSIVKYLAELHGGHAEAFSTGKGQGSCFRVILPLTGRGRIELPDETKAIQKSEKSGSPSSLTLKDYKILVIEDSPDNRILIKKILSRLGAEVVDVESAQAARQALENYLPDVIVSDIGMPEENGLQFIKKLRSRKELKQSQIPAIALTAYVRDEEKQEALQAGFQSHVAKPVNEKTLISEIFRIVH